MNSTAALKSCLNCRRRKVKCDKSVPDCHPCLNSGLSCSYRSGEVDHTKLRSTRACQSCRVQKRRCSGDLPKCSRCLQQGDPCLYISNRSMLSNIGIKEFYAEIDSDRYHQLVVELISSTLSKNLQFLAGSFLDKDKILGDVHAGTQPKILTQALVGMSLDSIGLDLEEWWFDKHLADILSCLQQIELNLFISLLLNVLWTWAKKARRNFFVVPLLCRMAFSLLLHLEELVRPMTVLESELRRRMMWTCFLLDKLVAAGLPELTCCELSVLGSLKLPSDIIGEDGGQLCLGNVGLSASTTTAPLGILAFSIHLGQLRHLTLTYVRSADKNLDRWWLTDSMIKRIDRDLQGLVRRLPPDLKYSKRNLVNRPSVSESRFFFVSHLWVHQIFCDLYRLAIPGMRESSPEIILSLIPQEMLVQAQSDCIRNAVAICDIISDNLEFINSPETIGDILTFILQSARLLLVYVRQQQNININFSLEVSEIARFLNCCLSILLHDGAKNLSQARIICHFIVNSCHQLELHDKVPLLSEAGALQLPNGQEHQSQLALLPVFAEREMITPANLRSTTLESYVYSANTYDDYLEFS
jgi:hypothetical protein